jgi:hypothetical protein
VRDNVVSAAGGASRLGVFAASPFPAGGSAALVSNADVVRGDATAAVNARENALIVGKRSAWFFDSARNNTGSTSPGRSATNFASGGGAWWITWYKSDGTLSPTNGPRPASISYAMHASDHWSVR